MAAHVPDKPSLEGLEQTWATRWERAGTYRFDRARARHEVYAIDTPPPTVSGSLHVGHVFSYTHTDLLARFWRMRGREVFYPMGWDDNGLPTERRVQNHFGVRCDPSLPYDASFEPSGQPATGPVSVSRQNFIELCHRLTAEDEQAFEQLFRVLGLSVDWTITYATIDDRSRRCAQRAFLRNLARGEAYHAEAPTLWDVDFRTAVAQAELEDRELAGAYHRIAFQRTDGGGPVHIETTRPELIPACVALVAHPDDHRYRPLFGTEVTTPLFATRVPVLAHALADPEKGSGLAMICTFGDVTDVTWWRELDLPVRSIVGRDGRIVAVPPPGVPANEAWSELAGKTVKQARGAVVDLLRRSGDLDGEPRPVTHAVKFYERGERPLEIVTSRQWYITNGGRDLTLREALLERGRQLRWHPAFMRARYESWVGGLSGDWLISRQRFFGVPFPLWYPIEGDGRVAHDRPIVPAEERLPVDPSTDVPDGYAEGQRDQPGGFTADTDVMDTWATSSLTPHIAGGWEDDDDLFARVFPYDLRPQAHEIIRTWLFSTVVRSHLEHGCLPWTDAAISGWVLDPDRKKMSKSKGNVVTPIGLLRRYGSDAVRYWAAAGRPGTDTAFDEGQMKVGRRLAIKVLNASRFVLSLPVPDGEVTQPADASLLARLADLIAEATTAFEGYDYARALERTESFFWSFCDDYVELVKNRAYTAGAGGASANRALRLALSSLLRLFAPFLPFVTEEVWSWWQPGSVHRAPWPDPAEVRVASSAADGMVLDVAAAVLGEVRKAKSEAKLSQRAQVERVVVRDDTGRLHALRAAEADLREAGSIADLVLEEAAEPSVDVRLAPVAAG
ncbi:MAG: valine--tRNA ligase [Actinomycetota bacterium]|nr:valine--tRNA ligase [Actinomycetota bacterium]